MTSSIETHPQKQKQNDRQALNQFIETMKTHDAEMEAAIRKGEIHVNYANPEDNPYLVATRKTVEKYRKENKPISLTMPEGPTK